MLRQIRATPTLLEVQSIRPLAIRFPLVMSSVHNSFLGKKTCHTVKPSSALENLAERRVAAKGSHEYDLQNSVCDFQSVATVASRVSPTNLRHECKLETPGLCSSQIHNSAPVRYCRA